MDELVTCCIDALSCSRCFLCTNLPAPGNMDCSASLGAQPHPLRLQQRSSAQSRAAAMDGYRQSESDRDRGGAKMRTCALPGAMRSWAFSRSSERKTQEHSSADTPNHGRKERNGEQLVRLAPGGARGSGGRAGAGLHIDIGFLRFCPRDRSRSVRFTPQENFHTTETNPTISYRTFCSDLVSKCAMPLRRGPAWQTSGSSNFGTPEGRETTA